LRVSRSSSLPYTTHFRSVEHLVSCAQRAHAEGCGNLIPYGRHVQVPSVCQRIAEPSGPHADSKGATGFGNTLANAGDLDVTAIGDRKSTRLNSSHVKISY